MNLVKNAIINPETTERYEGIRTADVVESMEKSGWNISDSSARRKYKGDPLTSYHVVRMQHSKFKVDNDYLELVLVNSHDKTSSFIVDISVFSGLYVQTVWFLAIIF